MNASPALSVIVLVLLLVPPSPVEAHEPVPSSRQLLRTALLYNTPSPSEPSPPVRVGFDKVQHFTFSFLWTVGSQYTLVVKAGMSEGDALPLSVVSAAAVGVAKEVYDWRRKGGTGFSRSDLLADGLGVAAAVGLILL